MLFRSVMGSSDKKNYKILHKLAKLGLSYVYGKNEWRVNVLNITAAPNDSLWMLLQHRNKREKCMVSHLATSYKKELQTLHVVDYMVP